MIFAIKTAITVRSHRKTMDSLVAMILKSNSQAQLVLISPWVTLENDKNSVLPHAEKLEAMDAYALALERYAQEKEYLFLNPNAYLLEYFAIHQPLLYTYDGIHPNAQKGTDLYCKAILESALTATAHTS